VTTFHRLPEILVHDQPRLAQFTASLD